MTSNLDACDKMQEAHFSESAHKSSKSLRSVITNERKGQKPLESQIFIAINNEEVNHSAKVTEQLHTFFTQVTELAPNGFDQIARSQDNETDQTVIDCRQTSLILNPNKQLRRKC